MAFVANGQINMLFGLFKSRNTRAKAPFALSLSLSFSSLPPLRGPLTLGMGGS